MTNRIPPTGKASYKDHLQEKSLSYDHNNLIRLYEILLANSFGNKDYIKKKYKTERKPPASNFAANLFENIQQTRQNEVLIQYPPVFHGSPYAQKYSPMPTYHPHGPNNVIRKPIPKYPKLMSCPVCSKSFHSPLYLEVHQLLHVSKQHQEYVCNICNENFTTSVKLDIHKRLHEGLEPLNLCGSSEKNENNLKSQEPGEPVEIPKNLLIPCDSPKNDENISKSQESAETTDEMPLTPPLSCGSPKDEGNGSGSQEPAQPVEILKNLLIPCDSPKNDENSLKSEESAQTTEEMSPTPSLSCDSPEDEANSSKSQKSAEKTLEIPFKCQICSKIFKYYTSFKRHRWIHERRDRDRFSCAICHRKYGWKQNLKAHIIKNSHFSS